MAFSQLFLGFLQPVALGSGTVLFLLLFVHIRTPHRSPAVVNRQTSR
jgi:hypothetical protein